MSERTARGPAAEPDAVGEYKAILQRVLEARPSGARRLHVPVAVSPAR